MFQREYFLSRILSGYLRYPLQKKLLKIYSPNRDVLYEAQEIYINTYNNGIDTGLMTDEDVYDMMLDNELWTEENEKNLTTVLPKHIEYWKIELYKAVFRSKDREKYRKYLAAAKSEFNKLNILRHSFDHATVGGVANYAKFQYIIENSTFDIKNKKYNWIKSSPYLAMVYFQDNIISEDTLRELARTSPWDSIWSASKKNGRIFDKAGVDLSIEQQRLITWSSMFDSIRESSDCPPDDVLTDDDMLDGWLLIKKQEREAQGNKNQADGVVKNDKIAGADDIFLPAQTVDDARKIDMLNSNNARSIKKQRFNYLSKRETVNELELPDVKQQLDMEITQTMLAAARSKR